VSSKEGGKDRLEINIKQFQSTFYQTPQIQYHYNHQGEKIELSLSVSSINFQFNFHSNFHPIPSSSLSLSLSPWWSAWKRIKNGSSVKEGKVTESKDLLTITREAAVVAELQLQVLVSIACLWQVGASHQSQDLVDSSNSSTFPYLQWSHNSHFLSSKFITINNYNTNFSSNTNSIIFSRNTLWETESHPIPVYPLQACLIMSLCQQIMVMEQTEEWAVITLLSQIMLHLPILIRMEEFQTQTIAATMHLQQQQPQQ
jgi:hypothetical protein